ncbi:MAG TPA: S8 family peptidase [Patescibacteria group bacterium]|jgi:serine protease AprX|nr:S8 family peptidase [Patescibacteria group bacterium]
MRNLPTPRSVTGLLLAFAFTSALAAGAGANHPRSKMSSDLASQIDDGNGPRNVDVIVQGVSSSLDTLRSHLRQHGGTPGRELGLVDGLVASVPVSELDAIAQDPRVRRMTPDRPLAAAMNIAGQAAGFNWPAGSTPAAGGPIGRGIGVAVIDSGIYPHEDLGSAVVATVDFVDPTRAGNDLTQDPYGHGTHVAGIIAGRPVHSSDRDGSFGGVAPGSHLISLRVLDHKGAGMSSDVIAALAWCVQHKDEYGIRVVNMSLGQPVADPSSDDPLDQAVEIAWRAGLVVVTAGGNAGLLGSGYGMISSPANDPLVIAVGALDDRGTPDRRDDQTAAFSSKGPTRFDFSIKPDVVAPGTRIVSLRVPHSTLDRALPDARVSINSAGSGTAFEPRYFELSGSSMAAALVSGTAAVMLEADPTLSPDDIKARLMKHANHLGTQDIYTRGAGAIDAGAALAGNERAAASPSPSVFLAADSDTVLIEETGPAWGDASLWSLESLYGDPALWSEEVTRTISLFDDACMTGEGITWQHAVAEGIIWQTLTSEGLTWQHLTGSGLTWQHSLGDGTCP